MLTLTKFNRGLVGRIGRRHGQFRQRMANAIIQAANYRGWPVVTEDMLMLSHGMDLLAAATILPYHSNLPAGCQELLMLYLDLDGMENLAAGCYVVRAFRDETGCFSETGKLVDLNGVFVRNCRIRQEDRYEDLLGTKPCVMGAAPKLDSLIRRGESYAIEGMLPEGTPFLVALDF